MIKKNTITMHILLFVGTVISSCGTEGGTYNETTPPKIYTTYTFNGSISDIGSDDGGVIAVGGYQVGDNVSAKFAVDFNGQAKMTLNSGEIIIPVDPQMTNDVHAYFYAKHIGGTVMPVINGGINNGPSNVKVFELGYNESSPLGNSGVLKGGSENSNILIAKGSQTDFADVQDWAVGEHLLGLLRSCSDNNCSVMRADFVLTSINNETIE